MDKTDWMINCVQPSLKSESIYCFLWIQKQIRTHIVNQELLVAQYILDSVDQYILDSVDQYILDSVDQ